jgi:hypothetical protein
MERWKTHYRYPTAIFPIPMPMSNVVFALTCVLSRMESVENAVYVRIAMAVYIRWFTEILAPCI